MVVTYSIMKPPWSVSWSEFLSGRFGFRYVISVLRRSLHTHPIRHNRRRQFKGGPTRQASVGVSEACFPEIFETVGCQSCDFMHFGGQSVKENELFIIMIIELHVVSSAVSPFWINFLLKTSQSASLTLLLSVQIVLRGKAGHKFHFTSSRISPFYWKPCDLCQLPYQQSNHPKCLETASLLFRVPNSRPPKLYGRVTFSSPHPCPLGSPLWLIPPSFILKIQWSSQKSSVPLPRR